MLNTEPQRNGNKYNNGPDVHLRSSLPSGQCSAGLQPIFAKKGALLPTKLVIHPFTKNRRISKDGPVDAQDFFFNDDHDYHKERKAAVPKVTTCVRVELSAKLVKRKSVACIMPPSYSCTQSIVNAQICRKKPSEMEVNWSVHVL
uniref:Uncharacterized protein n=1 Tax=Panagrellus redivivus TaxID=6233 RepID=A0A7E4UPR3_PANRE